MGRSVRGRSVMRLCAVLCSVCSAPLLSRLFPSIFAVASVVARGRCGRASVTAASATRGRRRCRLAQAALQLSDLSAEALGLALLRAVRARRAVGGRRRAAVHC